MPWEVYYWCPRPKRQGSNISKIKHGWGQTDLIKNLKLNRGNTIKAQCQTLNDCSVLKKSLQE